MGESAIEKALKRINDQMERMGTMSKLEIRFLAVDNASKIMTKIWDTAKKIGNSAWDMTLKAVDLATPCIKGIMKLVKTPIVGFAKIIGVDLSLEGILNTSKTFEQSMVNVRSLLKISDTEYGQLVKSAKQFGAESMFSAADVGGAMEVMAKSGKSTTDIISEIPKIMDFAAMAGLSLSAGASMMINGSTEAELKKLGFAIDGVVEGAANARLDTLQGSMTLLKHAAEGVQIAIGEKLSPVFRKFLDWITEKMPQIQEVAMEVCDFIVEKIHGIEESIKEMTNSDAWYSAEGLWEKLMVAWDQVIIQPFEKWWGSGGELFVKEKASEMGNTLGSALNDGIMGILGFTNGDGRQEGISLGRTFASGFKEGFNLLEIMTGIWGAIHKMMSENPLLATVGISATLLPVASNGLQTAFYANQIIGARWNDPSNPVSGADRIKEVAFIVKPVAGLLGIIGGVAGLKSAFDDFVGAVTDEKRRGGYLARGSAKTGMIATGALIGNFIGGKFPLIGKALGTAIGTGLGGLIALATNDALGKFLSESEDGTLELERAMYGLEESTTKYQESIEKNDRTKELIEEYERLEEKIESGTLSFDQMEEAEENMFSIVQELSGLHDGLITKYERENGLLAAKRDLILAVSEAEKDSNKNKMQADLLAATNALVGQQDNYNKAVDAQSEYQQEYDTYNEMYGIVRPEYEKYFRNGSQMIELEEQEGWETSEEYQKLVTENNAIWENMKQELANQGYWDEISKLDPKGDYNNLTYENFHKLYELIYGKTQDTGTLISEAENVQTELDNYATTAYDSKKGLLEGEMGMSFEEASKAFYEMNSDAQHAYYDAREELIEFAQSLGIVPKDLETDVNKWREILLEEGASYETQGTESDQTESDPLGFARNSILTSMEDYDLADGNIWNSYNREKSHLEENMGITFEEGRESFDNMSEAMKQTFSNATSDLELFRNIILGLPETVDINLNVHTNFLGTSVETPTDAESNSPLESNNMSSSSELSTIPESNSLSIPNVVAHAFGGIMTKPHIGLVAEAGAEAIIPLSGGQRNRGLALWERTGELLGAENYGNERSASIYPLIPTIEPDSSETIPRSSSGEKVAIEVNISNINIDSNGSPEEVVNGIANNLATTLEQAWNNMPTVLRR